MTSAMAMARIDLQATIDLYVQSTEVLGAQAL